MCKVWKAYHPCLCRAKDRDITHTCERALEAQEACHRIYQVTYRYTVSPDAFGLGCEKHLAGTARYTAQELDRITLLEEGMLMESPRSASFPPRSKRSADVRSRAAAAGVRRVRSESRRGERFRKQHAKTREVEKTVRFSNPEAVTIPDTPMQRTRKSSSHNQYPSPEQPRLPDHATMKRHSGSFQPQADSYPGRQFQTGSHATPRLPQKLDNVYSRSYHMRRVYTDPCSNRNVPRNRFQHGCQPRTSDFAAPGSPRTPSADFNDGQLPYQGDRKRSRRDHQQPQQKHRKRRSKEVEEPKDICDILVDCMRWLFRGTEY